jgi:hypothetical protein
LIKIRVNKNFSSKSLFDNFKLYFSFINLTKEREKEQEQGEEKMKEQIHE